MPRQVSKTVQLTDEPLSSQDGSWDPAPATPRTQGGGGGGLIGLLFRRKMEHMAQASTAASEGSWRTWAFLAQSKALATSSEAVQSEARGPCLAAGASACICEMLCTHAGRVGHTQEC